MFVRQDVPHHKVNGDSGRPTQIAVAKFEKDEKDEIGTKVSAQAKDNGEHDERFNTPTRKRPVPPLREVRFNFYGVTAKQDPYGKFNQRATSQVRPAVSTW